MFHLKHVNTMGEKLKDPGIGINIIQTHSTGRQVAVKQKLMYPLKPSLKLRLKVQLVICKVLRHTNSPRRPVTFRHQ